MEDVEQTSKDPVFPGFDYANPDNGYLAVANNNFNLWQNIDNLAELKVVLYIVRHTWGFREYEKLKHLTIDEFMNGRKANGERMDEGTKLSESAVKSGLAKAIKDGYVVCEVNESDKARIQKSYKLKMNEATRKKEEESIDGSEGLNVTPEDSKRTPEGLNKASEGLKRTGRGFKNSPRTEKNTFERNFSNKTEEKGVHQFSDKKNEGDEQPQPLMLGFVKMAMRDCLQYCGKSVTDTHILTRTDDIFQRSGLDKPDLRVKVDSVLNDLRASGNRDIEAFFRRLEKVLQLEPIAMEG